MVMQAEQPRVRRASRLSESSEASSQRQNVGSTGRLISAAGGGLLVLRGLQRGGLGGIAEAGLGAMFLRRGVTGHCPVSEKLGINTNGHGQASPKEFFDHGIHVVTAYTINKPANELYDFWRNFENLPNFMTHLEQVTVLDNKKSRWKAKVPAGYKVEWEAEIINEEPNRLIAWRSLEGADVNNSGSVRFVDTSGRGTEVRVVLDYIPPMGKFGALLAKMFGEEPKQQIKEDLRHFKQLMESGEIPTAQGPRGKCQHHAARQRRNV